MSDLTDALQSSNNLSLVAIFGHKSDLIDHQVPTTSSHENEQTSTTCTKPLILKDSGHSNNSLFRNAKDTHITLLVPNRSTHITS